jgi:DNA-binding NarL/FixJ family response regulator
VRFTQGPMSTDSPFAHVGGGDFEKMHVEKRSTGRSARWTPRWAMDDGKVRLVVYNYLASYAKHPHPSSKPQVGLSLMDYERMAAKKRQTVGEHLAAGYLNPDSGSAKHFAVIEAHGGNTAAYYTTIIYRAYRQGLLATDIAEEFGMSHVSVRMVLKRINDYARKLFPAEDQFQRHKTAKPTSANIGCRERRQVYKTLQYKRTRVQYLADLEAARKLKATAKDLKKAELAAKREAYFEQQAKILAEKNAANAKAQEERRLRKAEMDAAQAKVREAKARRNEQIVELFKNGCSTKEVAEQCGCTPDWANKIAKRFGIPSGRKPQIGSVEKQKRDDRIVELYQQGYMAKEIAKEIGFCAGVVAKVVCERGVKHGSQNRMRDERNKRIADLYMQGLTSKQVGISRDRVIGILGELKVRHGNMQKVMTAKKLAADSMYHEVAFWLRNGVTYRDLGPAFGMSHQVIRHRMIQSGLAEGRKNGKRSDSKNIGAGRTPEETPGGTSKGCKARTPHRVERGSGGYQASSASRRASGRRRTGRRVPTRPYKGKGQAAPKRPSRVRVHRSNKRGVSRTRR